MKLTKKALFITLIMLALFAMVSAQRSEDDDRNTAPTVGTGGPVGGATGLFTVYDASTLQKGEYTFSAAYSNYDRDPGDVDITEVPLSFQYGLTNRFEIFFNTDAYRGIKVNSPRNLSGFYLPNSNAGSSLPAIIVGPGSGFLGGFELFRPTGEQTFASYPYTGALGGDYGFGNTVAGNAAYALEFGAAFNVVNQVTLGPPTAGSGASLFPGVGSVYGGILPGVVLRTAIRPDDGMIEALEVPTTFTVAPSYLPDAPLLNRTWGTSAFSTFTVGGKYRFTSTENATGVALLGFYRFYKDSADSIGGFNQLQRGASPGGSGDFGLVFAADRRIRKWANISGNIGYIYNSDIEGNNATLLDRPAEMIWAAGIDFPVNEHFQPILEARGVQYVGGRTPNAFENDPVEGLAGFRYFFRRWVGFSLAYRYHANQQDRDLFEDEQFSGSANIVSLTTTQAVQNNAFNGVPPGFRTSSDPHGFMIQGFIGRRNERGGLAIPNIPADVTNIELSKKTLTLPCAAGTRSASGGCNDDMTVSVTTNASDQENDPLTYNYTVTGGRIVGTGQNVSWDLSGVGKGVYTITAGVDDGCGDCGLKKNETVEVVDCTDCGDICSCFDDVDMTGGSVEPGQLLVFTATRRGGNIADSEMRYDWSVDKGTIIAGQGTSSISVDTTGLRNESVRASVVVESATCGCRVLDNEVGNVLGKIEPLFIEELGDQPNDEIRARIDNYIQTLQGDPTSTGYIVNYGSARDVARREALIRNHLRFRGFDESRVTFVNGGVERTIRTRLWRVPAGADTSLIDE